jgi:hypothetical protein
VWQELGRSDQRRATEAIAKLIDENDGIAAVVLGDVKGKLGQYQYGPESIAFELFQNADDAAVELGRITAHSHGGCGVPEYARRFVLQTNASGTRFLHWGRAVNARGPVGFDGERRGFDRDLEKMLILSGSDKQAEHGVTGILPRPLSATATKAGRDVLTRFAPGVRAAGTLIELPRLDRSDPARVLGRFSSLAGMLAAFAREIRRIGIHREDETPMA